MRIIFRFLLFSIISFFITGCAIGQKIEYRGVSDFQASYKIESLTLGVHDQRPYVLTRDKEPKFVGLSKSLYGIPYGVTTKSGNALADDFASLIAETLAKSNIGVVVVQLSPYIQKDDAITNILKVETDSYILITLNEWKTESHFRMGLFYDVSLDVISPENKIIATARQDGFDFFNDETPGRENLASAVVDIFGKLFNDQNVRNALKAK